MKWTNINQANDWLDNVFSRAARIVEGDTYQHINGDWRIVYEGREWFKRERNHQLHPAVYRMMETYKPDDWQQLLLEWPHRSQTDANRIAYTRDERSGVADRQTVTSIGKYLRRHFSHASDDLIRDIAAQFTYGGDIRIVDNVDDMVHAVIHGPASCMSKDFHFTCDDGEQRHPYAVYDPSLGWAMAVRKEDDRILGRCLVWRGDVKIFVRSYKRERDERSHSGSDEAIEMWLKSQGYTRESYWPDGTPLMRYELRSGNYLMPYIDGGTQRVDVDTFRIDDNGEIEADETSGSASAHSATCPVCGARYNDEEEGGWVGVHEDEHVCQHCLDNDYTYAYSRRGNEYYIPNDRVVYVNHSYYDTEYLSDNNIVELADGDYCDLDNAVYVESEDAYYEDGDDRIVYAEDSERYEMKNDCWRCTETGEWYTDAVDYVEIDGDKYHPDNAPETTDDEGEQQ